MIFVYLLLFCILFGTVSPASILFPANERFETVEETEIENADEYVDPMNTGSFLYDSRAKSSTAKKLLGYNIQVRDFVSKDSRYFRAHPTFMKCAQKVIMKLRKNGISVEILAGFKTASEAPDQTIVGKYLRSGCAMQLGIREGSTGAVDDIASAVLQSCPSIIERDHRDLGLILMSDRVHFHISGPDSEGPLYNFDGYSGSISDLDSWVQDEINNGLEPNASPTCDLFTPLSNGHHHPAAKTQDQMVGTLDVKITRSMTTDFGRLVQYQGSNIAFENEEGSSSWCAEDGIMCPNCATKIKGNSLTNRCADRVMSSRLLTLLNKLQRKVRLAMNDKLKVTEAWDEPHSGGTDGDSGTDELHYEGRAAKLQLVGANTENGLGELSQYAICLGADYVEHRGTYLYVAVKRAQDGATKTLFPSIELLSVDSPTESASLYNLPAQFSESEAKQYPLYDASGRADTFIAPGVTMGQFASPGYRYFRIHPKLVECYSDIIYHENKRRNETAPEIVVEVLRGYLTNEQNKRKFDVIHDKRYNTHNLGLALQIRYKQTASLPATYTPYRLLYTVIDKCAPRFDAIKKEMGVGLYPDSVFVDIRTEFHIMKESLDNLPDGVDRDTFENVIEDRFLLAKQRRIVDPENYNSACLFANKPEPQSCGFQHVHSEGVKRRRRRRSTNPNECIPNRYTPFCSSTVEHRNKVLAEITSMLDRKHYTCRSRDEIMAALQGCFGECGTCMEGEVFESKQEHCNNLLHWVDWKLMNRDADITNFFLRSNDVSRVHACENGADCIENAPLFSLIAPSAEYIYRPDETKSVEEELYSSVDNPLPAYQLLDDIYAIQAFGNVKFWVKDDSEMTALKRQLEVVMLYNKNVTLIEVYVDKYQISRDSVTGVIEKAAREMTITGCPDVTRKTLTPYVVKDVPPEYRKRAAEYPSVRKQIRDYHKNYEARWAQRNLLI